MSCIDYFFLDRVKYHDVYVAFPVAAGGDVERMIIVILIFGSLQ